MTNDETNPNDENRNSSWPIKGLLSFGLCHSFVIRHSCFIIFPLHPLRRFDPQKLQAALQNSRGKIAQRQTRTARRFLCFQHGASFVKRVEAVRQLEQIIRQNVWTEPV